MILYFIFQSIFTWATIPMDYIDSLIGNFGNYIQSIMPDNILRDILVDGIIAGVGAIIIFLPQILLLMFSDGALLQVEGQLLHMHFNRSFLHQVFISNIKYIFRMNGFLYLSENISVF